MLRAAIVSFVLTLAAGPSAPLFCEVWCNSQEAASAGCQHEDGTGTPGITGNDDCDGVPAGVIGFVREDVRRAAAAPDDQHTVLAGRLRFAPAPTAIRSGHDPGRQPLFAARPLTISLRI